MPQPTPFGLYVHWPYCVSKCPYCDFNSHVAQTVDHDLWADCFEQEIQRVYQESPNQKVSSVFFGGGTPSLMAPKTVARILDAAHKAWGLRDDVEITLEANPTTVEAHTFPAFRDAGINRLSIGIQSLYDDDLKFLGRAHSAQEGRQALDYAQRYFDRYSFDLIYARPDQGLKAWQHELEAALSLSAGHLSLYQLTIESGTPFFRDGVPAADEDLGADLYDLTQEITSAHGLPAYEVSNHATLGQESRHNLVYWQGYDYIGIGPGAHSRLNNQAIHQIYKPDLWLKAVQNDQSGEQKRKNIPLQERAVERLMMGLRLFKGIDRPTFQAQTGQDVLTTLDPEAVTLLSDHDLIALTSDNLRVTQDGMKCLNAVLDKILK